MSYYLNDISETVDSHKKRGIKPLRCPLSMAPTPLWVPIETNKKPQENSLLLFLCPFLFNCSTWFLFFVHFGCTLARFRYLSPFQITLSRIEKNTYPRKMSLVEKRHVSMPQQDFPGRTLPKPWGTECSSWSRPFLRREQAIFCGKLAYSDILPCVLLLLLLFDSWREEGEGR